MQNNEDHLRLLKQIAAGQDRLVYLEDEMQMNKKLMLLVTVIALATILLNRKCQ